MNSEARNTRVQKYCSYCGQEYIDEQEADGNLCPECRED